MDSLELVKRISKIEREIHKLENTLAAVKATNTDQHTVNHEDLSMEAAMHAEKIACSIRDIVFEANLVPHKKLMNAAADAHGIEISHKPELVSISLPGLLPKRYKKYNSGFLTDPLFAALESYLLKNPIPFFTECVICFCHEYEKINSNHTRDYDNMECKFILDTISMFLLTDDSPKLCDAYHTTRLHEHNRTTVIIMTRKRFAKWLQDNNPEHENMVSF